MGLIESSRPLREERAAMVRDQLYERGIRDPRVLAAMGSLPRELFVPRALRAEAYADRPLPIGFDQTISQPYIVALTLEALELTGDETVLEVGAGSGYQAALLGLLVRRVIAIEIRAPLVAYAQSTLQTSGVENVELVQGDGSLGWVDAAPYDAIAVAAAAPIVPVALVDQLVEGGRMVFPLGPSDSQVLMRFRREGRSLYGRALENCRFVPLRHRASDVQRRRLCDHRHVVVDGNRSPWR